MNGDGDVYVESVGEHAEVVLKTGKVRVDGDVYVGDVEDGLGALATAAARRIEELVDGHIDLWETVRALNATSVRMRGVDEALSNRVDDVAGANDDSASRIHSLNVTLRDVKIDTTDRIATLNATDAEMKGVAAGLSSRIDALTDVWVNELNTTNRTLVVTDAKLASRIDALNATQFELRGTDEGLLTRIHAVRDTLVDANEALTNRIEAINATKLQSDINATMAELVELTRAVANLTPPKCLPPGGGGLAYNGTGWVCTCVDSWTGNTCETPPQPPLPPPPPPPPPPTPPTPSPPPSLTRCDIVAPAHGGMGNCSTTLQFGESCLFTCDNGMKLSQPTICQDGALALGRCVAIAYDCQYFESTSSAGYVVPYYDRDANGLLDMLYMPADGKINVLSQTTPRVFESDELVSNAPSGASLCVYGTGEYNGDGVMDFFLVGAASPGTSWGSSRGTADVLYTSKTDGSFEAKSYANNYWGNRCTSADFNNDLLQDAAVSNVWFSDPVRVYVSSNATGTGVLGNPYSLSGSPRFGHDISHGDFDGDGILDLVVVSSDNHGDYVYFGTGDGTFTSPLFVSQGSRGAVAVCDVNGDGHMDIIIGDYYSNRSLQVYVNNGSGSRTSLFSSVQIQGLSVVYGLACADIDHDGDADLVIGGRFVLWNSGQSPYFSTSEALSLPPKSRNGNYIEYATRLVDVDGDGLLDIVSNKWMCFAGTAGQCLNVTAPAHGSLGDCVAPLMDGASCRPACDEGYEIVASATCSSGQFTPATCRIAPVLWARFDNPNAVGEDSSRVGVDLVATGDGVKHEFDSERGGVLRVSNCDHLESTSYPPELPRGGDSYTYGFWFKVNTSSINVAYNQGWGMAGFGATGGCGQRKSAGIDIGALSRPGKVNTGHWCHDMFGPAGANANDLGRALHDGAWHHVAVTYHGDTGVETIYEDFTSLASRTVGILNIQPGKVHIGDTSGLLIGLTAADVKCARAPGGLLDDFAVFDRALSLAELTDFFAPRT